MFRPRSRTWIDESLFIEKEYASLVDDDSEQAALLVESQLRGEEL